MVGCKEKEKTKDFEQDTPRTRVMKAWAHRTNVALCTIFFFYQVSELSKKKKAFKTT